MQFDTIYHEHLYYYSLTALDHLFRRHGLVIEDCELLSIHGGSLRIFVRHEAGATPGPARARAAGGRGRWGVYTNAPYARFAAGVEEVKVELAR